jgi:UDP-GlcNAc:undecaprenyl-phosphate GlcNAc-1-phosphate transferase
MNGLAAAVLAAVVSNLLAPLVVGLAFRVGAVDRPGVRKRHKGTIPRLGGVSVVAGLVFGVASVILFRSTDRNSLVPWDDAAVLVVSTSLIFLVGVVDDLMGLPVWKKLLFQSVAACLLVGLGPPWRFDSFGLPGGLELEVGTAAGYLLTVVWLLGITNAINFLDGLDGLASGVVGIIAASFVVLAVLLNSPFIVVLMSAVVGSCLGFLPYNREPARLFLGDSGALTLGFLLAAASVNAGLKSPTAVAVLVPILALGLPVIDAVLVIFVRFLEKPDAAVLDRFLRVFAADRNHLHHRLQDWLSTNRVVVRWIYGLALLFTVMALSVAFTRSASLGVVLVAVEVSVIVLMRQPGLARGARATVRTEPLSRQARENTARAEKRIA